MNTKFLLIVGCLLILPSVMMAEEMETLKFKCGIQLEGHVLCQIPGKRIVFSIDRTKATVDSRLIVINQSEISFRNKGEIKKDKSLWKTDSVKHTILSDLFKGYSRKVNILEEGAYITFVDSVHGEGEFCMSDIYSITYQERDTLSLNALMDVIELVNNEICKGQILEKIVGDCIKIKTDDGLVRSILNKDIVSFRKEPLNPNVDIFKQSKYIYELNGYRGVIIEQKNDGNKSQITLLIRNGEKITFLLKDVKRISSFANDEYTEKTDVKVDAGEVYFCGNLVSPVEASSSYDFSYIIPSGNNLLLKEDSIGGLLVVEMADTRESKSYKLLKVNPHKNSYVFDENAVWDEKPIKEESVSRNGTLRRVYEVYKGIAYAFYSRNTNKAYLCVIE